MVRRFGFCCQHQVYNSNRSPLFFFDEANNPTTRSAYWWVGVGDKRHWNMEVGFKTVLADQFQVPVLTNPADIQPFTQLCKHQTKKRKTA